MARMDEETLATAVGAAITDAVSFIDNDIGGQRALASAYYRGEPFGDEEEGRSRFVSRDVHDVIGAILPSILRVFFGPEQIVEFVPQGQEDVDAAQQATDYVNYIVQRDNPGFQVLYAAFKDALIRKCGFVKYWWDDSEEVSTVEYTGLDDVALTKLLEDLQGAQKAEVIESGQDEENGLSVTIKLTKRKDRVRIEAIPPEEFLIARDARDLDTARFVGHRSMKTVSDLVAMGYKSDDIDDAAQDADDLAMTFEARERNPFTTQFGVVGTEDPSMRLVLYTEGYMLADVDGDGIAERVKVCTIGSEYKLIHHEGCKDHPFADFPAEPEPHTFFGECPAEDVMDIQRVKSALIRNTLDGLSLALNPRMGVIEGKVNLDDAMNTEIGALVRMKAQGDFFPVPTQDTSGSAFQALTYMDAVKESRTGMSSVSQGLNPDTLQNMTATAASAQFSQSQQHIEIIARIFAETGMKRLFRGILRLVVENQRSQRMVQLRNKWVPVDPRAWRVDMDVTANVALGAGTNQEKAQLLALVATKQEQIIMQAGPNNPLCGLPQLYETYSQFLTLGGFKNPDAFFKDPSQPDPTQAQQAPPPPSADAIKARAQAEESAAKVRIQSEQLRLEIEKFKLAAKNAEHAQFLAEEKLRNEAAQADADRAARTALELHKINSEFDKSVTIAQINADASALRAKADLLIQASEAQDRDQSPPAVYTPPADFGDGLADIGELS